MKSSSSSCRVGTAVALALAAAVAAGPARADIVLLGADYFATIQPTSFTPLGVLNPLAGLPFGPGITDTIVHRQGDCSLGLATSGSNCTIPIELVALSLISTADPMVRLRESPTLASSGAMTIMSNGSGTGGTFDSFFDVFFELSFNGGSTFSPMGPLRLSSSDTAGTTIDPPTGLVDGLVGDQNANRHTNKGGDCAVLGQSRCVDFYLGNGNGIGAFVTERHPDGSVHTAIPVPEPSTWALFGLGLAAMAGLVGRRARRVDAGHGPGTEPQRS